MDYDKRYFELKGKNAEDIVKDLAYKSFLREWSYMNPMDSDNKEICDLLVDFDNTLIICQIKCIKYSGNDNRYIRKAFDDPIRQLIGSEKTLFSNNKPIILTNPYGHKHTFDSTKYKNIYRIVISIGNGEVPFCPTKKIDNDFIHIFDRSIEIILNELDTINDFCRYLSAKESLFATETIESIVADDETDLLGDYIYNGKSFDHLKKFNMIKFETGLWDEVSKKKAFLIKKEDDKTSYFWDHLIDLSHECPGDDYRDIAKELSRPNRFERRACAQTFLSAHSIAEQENRQLRRYFQFGDTTYVFLFSKQDYPRTLRSAQLNNICFVARDLYSERPKVLGIATEIGSMIEHTYDFVLFDFPTWSKENKKTARKLQKKHKILKNQI